MRFFLTFLEGLVSFLSPCMLPMLPLYIGYFAGGSGDKKRTLKHACAFVLGFTLVFCALGLFAGVLGQLLLRYRTTVNAVCGALVVLFGLSILDVVRLPFFKGISRAAEITGVFSALVFGMIYSVSLTPCVGAFLGAALMTASTSGSALHGFLLLLCYALGLGLPFLVSAVLIEQLRGAFDVVKRHYNVLNKICGVLLILVGLAMMFGLLNRLTAVLA